MSLQINNDLFRKELERIVGNDDSNFTGVDLATLIRNKYGRSYDVQLIKKVMTVLLYFFLQACENICMQVTVMYFTSETLFGNY